jgi:hypothetical protein
MNWKGFRRKRSQPNRGTFPAKPQKAFVRITGIPVEVRTEFHLNTNLSITVAPACYVCAVFTQ